MTQTQSLQDLYEKHHADQDFLIPISKLQLTLKTFDELYRIYPIWICPMRILNYDQRYFVHTPTNKDELFVDVGLYGRPRVGNFVAKDTGRKAEQFVRDVEGFQALYADTYMTNAEFKIMFDHRHYQECRVKYGAIKAFPDVYDKVSKAARK